MLGAGALQAQSPYRIRPAPTITVIGLGAGTVALGQYYSARNVPLTEDDILRNEGRGVWRIDRLATRRRSNAAARVSDIVGYGATLLPFGLLAGERVRETARDPALLYGQTLLLNAGVTSLVKNIVRRPRPYTYNPAVSLTEKQVRDARRSFFSGHTSNTAVNTFFAARVYHDYYGPRRGDGWVWVTAAALPAITGTTRVLSGNHYWTDVVVGYAIGAGIGVLVPRLAR